MSATAAKVIRRDLRRAVGASAINVIDQQSTTIRQLVDVNNRTVQRLDALEKALEQERIVALTLLKSYQQFRAHGFWQRFSWLFLGR